MDAEKFCWTLLNIPAEHKHSLGATNELVKASIKFYAQLPMARPAIIEYYSHYIFEKSIADYMSDVPKNLSTIEDDYNVLIDVQQGLTNLVFEHASEFATTISTWSIQLLGKLSQKYDRVVDTSNGLKHWLESDAVRVLLSLAAIGFWKPIEAVDEPVENDECVNTLLETYIKYSPAADWLVARLASSYVLPLTTRVLYNGLFIYQKNSVNGNNIKPIVLILEQIVGEHSLNLDCACKRLIQWSMLKNNRNNLRRYVIPYILKLAASSEKLLPFVYKTLLEIFTSSDAHLSILSNQRHHIWVNVGLKYPILIERMAEMALKIDKIAIDIVVNLINKSNKHSFALHIIMQMLNEAGKEYKKSCKHYPLILALTEGEAYKALCNILTYNCKSLTVSFVLHLLNYISQKQPCLFPKIVHYLLYHTTSITQLNLLVELIQAYYFSAPTTSAPSLHDTLLMTFTAPRQSDFVYTYFWQNLCNIMQQEKKGTTVFFKQGNFTKAASYHLIHIVIFFDEVLEQKLRKQNKQIINEDSEIALSVNEISPPPENEERLSKQTLNFLNVRSNKDSFVVNHNASICDNIARILEMLDISHITLISGVNCITTNNVLYRKLVDVIVKYFFYSLLLRQSSRRKSSIIAMKLLNKCCSTNRIGRILSTQLLVDGAVFKYSLLFGGTSPIYRHDAQSVSLFELNIKQGFTSQMSQRHLAVFRNEMDLNRKMQSLITETCSHRQRLLLEALSAAMSENVLAGPSIDALTSLSLWLVESISTDIMYNGLPWPEDEFTKITMERDLHIRRRFQSTPILWSLLRFIAIHRPALCYCSVLLRALTSVLIYQWLSWSYKNTPNLIFQELHCTTKNVLEILSLGQLLPAPLDTLSEVIPKLNAFEISFILRDCVWFYMKENVPAPILFQENQIGQFWRDSDTSNVPIRFIESLRTIMQKHLPDLASSYNQIFIQSYCTTSCSNQKM